MIRPATRVPPRRPVPPLGRRWPCHAALVGGALLALTSLAGAATASEGPPRARPDPAARAAAPSPSACLREVWAPPTGEICAATWGILPAAGSHNTEAEDRRYSCATMDGGTVLAITSRGDRPNSLLEFGRDVGGGGDVARLSAQIYIPEDYQPYVGGRLAFGIQIGDRGCASGGCLPEEQTGAKVRANFRVSDDGGSIVLADYSYHLDRRTRPRMTDSHWKGGERTLRAFGAGRKMTRALPKGEWVTLVLDVTLNTPGKADGSSLLSAYDAKGRLIDSAGYANVIYRPDASWTITGPVMTEKYNDTRPGPKNQTIYYRDYRLATGERAACGG
ncbi:hypothetical protein [Amaricoccus solimangrovi]|uniref:Polysaccharide lyase-like protein n=1 Tax=Amaricoccus solimangrovi TaxID=2589815 RepID=A0A501WS18_9RHOB|nr:hypothetical protein [Amaricoccus solimangrovi]TPE51632.1 hypothetical protein FJM51_07975 [Amaricoccus solimangrovi]